MASTYGPLQLKAPLPAWLCVKTFAHYLYVYLVRLLQQHKFNALGEVVPGVACQQMQSGRPAWGNLKANARCCHTRSSNLGWSETQKGVV